MTAEERTARFREWVDALVAELGGQRAVARALGLSAAYISKLRSGHITTVRATTLAASAENATANGLATPDWYQPSRQEKVMEATEARIVGLFLALSPARASALASYLKALSDLSDVLKEGPQCDE